MIPVGKLADPINEKQYETLSKLIQETETDEEKFLEWCEVDTLELLPYERFNSAHNLLKAKKARMDMAKEKAK